jgi:KaiC/GvpD/RAD55 family RecA-like ATPase
MAEKLGRLESGIHGLDPLMEGGFVKGSTNLVAGMTGTCKTIFSTQFLWHGLKQGEPGVYVSLEQDTKDILGEAMAFGFDFEPYIKKKKAIFTDEMPGSYNKLEKSIFDKIVKVEAKRFVLDSLSVVGMGAEDPEQASKLRRDLFKFFKALKTMGVTSILITEIPEDMPKKLSRFGFEEFVADGVVILNYLEYAAGGIPRSLIIRKMRQTNHGVDIYPFELTKKGIVIKKA